jgi:prenyltransferase beta subunit
LILGLIILVMASPLTAMAAPTRQDVIITFTVTLIDGSGGAVLHPGAPIPKMSNTFDITNVLNTLDAWIAADLLMPDRFLIENITAWINGLFLNETASDLGYGGFLPYSGAPNATLTASGFAVQALTLLNQTDTIDSSILIDFVVNLQHTNATLFPETVGAFTDTINRSATVSATYFAIQILDEYDAISQMNTSLAINWLNSSQMLSDPASVSYGGFANGRNTTTADLQTTYMALRGLEILDALSIIDQTAAIDYILPHYREDSNYPQFYGGFANTPDNSVATHFATFYAVAGLQILGAGNQLSSYDITNWVLSTQALDGGFADVSGATGFAPQTNLAISTLALLDQLGSLLLPVGPDLYVFPWWIVAVAVVVILIVLCIIIARRSEWF